MIYSCQEHVEIALDDAVLELETPPSLEKINYESEISTPCEYCRNPVAYIVGN